MQKPQPPLKSVNIEPSCPVVTVTIVFLNALPHFRAAVTSVLIQTYRDFELLLIDDGSTDGSLEYARSLQDPRIRVISDGANRKLSVRLNQSVRLARGEFYFRMDADDIMITDRIERQLVVLRTLPENAVLGGSAVCINTRNEVLGLRFGSADPGSVRGAKHAFVHPSVCARVAWFRGNPYSEDFLFHRAQDAELWIRTRRWTVFTNLAEPVIFYRECVDLNVENYLGTTFGLCGAVHRDRESGLFSKCIYLGVELARCWLICIATWSGLSYLVIRGRNRLPPRDLMEIYKVKLESILRLIPPSV